MTPKYVGFLLSVSIYHFETTLAIIYLFILFFILQLNFAGGKTMGFPSDKFRMRDVVALNILATTPKALAEGIRSSLSIHANEEIVEEQVQKNDEMLAKHNRKVEACFLGKFRVKLSKCVSSPPERLVRQLNETHISRIHDLLTTDPDWGVTLTGLISKEECKNKSNFKRENINNYTIEIIDGNYNLHALKRYQSEHADCILERDVLLYAGLSNEEAKSVGIARNRLTSNALPMTDMDYIKLIRQEVLEEYGEGRPGKDKRAIDFWNRVFPIIGLENNVSFFLIFSLQVHAFRFVIKVILNA